jgi:hypothetical protein
LLDIGEWKMNATYRLILYPNTARYWGVEDECHILLMYCIQTLIGIQEWRIDRNTPDITTETRFFPTSESLIRHDRLEIDNEYRSNFIFGSQVIVASLSLSLRRENTPINIFNALIYIGIYIGIGIYIERYV